jgi:transglutaminase-like putative cysteine protease
MPFYQITYNTQNEYSSLVHDAILEFLVFPASITGQEVTDLNYSCTPKSVCYTSENFFGFKILRFRLKKLDETFKFSLYAQVEKKESNPFDFKPVCLKKETEILTNHHFQIDNYLFLKESNYTLLPPDYFYPQKKKTENIFDFAQQVNKFVHETVEYDNRIVDPHRLLSDTLSEKRGVCQDLAHLMIAILRKNKIPARYVSGYLNQGNHAIGASAVHAWVEVLLPEIGWIGFDPTNNLMEDHHYIKIAHGQNIGDCNTIKGIIKGSGSNKTSYEVLVKEQNRENNQ